MRGNSEGASLFDNIKEFIGRIDGFFLKPDDVNIGVFILPDLELGPVGQKIEQFAAVDFIEGN